MKSDRGYNILLVSILSVVLLKSSYAQQLLASQLKIINIGYQFDIDNLLQFQIFSFILQVLIVYAVFIRTTRDYYIFKRQLITASHANQSLPLLVSSNIKDSYDGIAPLPGIFRYSWTPLWSNVFELVVFLQAVQSQQQELIVYNQNLFYAQTFIQIFLFMMAFKLLRFVQYTQMGFDFKAQADYYLEHFQGMQTTYVTIIQSFITFVLNCVVQWEQVRSSEEDGDDLIMKYVTTSLNSVGALGALVAILIYRFLLSKVYLEGEQRMHYKYRTLKEHTRLSQWAIQLIKAICMGWVMLLSVFFVVFFLLNILQMGLSLNYTRNLYANCGINFRESTEYLDMFYQKQTDNLQKIQPQQTVFNYNISDFSPLKGSKVTTPTSFDLIMGKCYDQDPKASCPYMILPNLYYLSAADNASVPLFENVPSSNQMGIFQDRRTRVSVANRTGTCNGTVEWFVDEFAISYDAQGPYDCNVGKNDTSAKIIFDYDTNFYGVGKKFEHRYQTSQDPVRKGNQTFQSYYQAAMLQKGTGTDGNSIIINTNADQPQLILSKPLADMVEKGFRAKTVACLGSECWNKDKIKDSITSYFKNNKILGSEGYTYVLWLYQKDVFLDGQNQQLNILQLQSNSAAISKFANKQVDREATQEIYVNQQKYTETHRQLQNCMKDKYRVGLEVGSPYFQGRVFYCVVELLFAFCAVALAFYKAVVESITQRQKYVQLKEKVVEQEKKLKSQMNNQVFESKKNADFLVSQDINISKSCKLCFRP